MARIRAVGKVRTYVSIHFNAFHSPGLAGTETYLNSENSGAASRKLAGGLQAGVVKRLKDGFTPKLRRLACFVAYALGMRP